MASKKRRKKASKTAKKVGKKRRKKASAVHVAKASGSELSLLHKINKKVTRIDRTVNAGLYLVHKAKKAKRAADLDKAWAEREESGYE